MVVYALASVAEIGSAAEPLIRRAVDGDMRAFEDLLALRLAPLLRLALAIIGDEVDARDAVQEACVKAWRGLPGLRDPASFDGWLRRILTNQCRETIRGKRRRRVREIAVSHIDPDFDVERSAGSAPDPAERAGQLEVLGRAFDRLDANARILLALHHLEGRSVAEISAELRLPATTIKWRLYRARTALQAALEHEQP